MIPLPFGYLSSLFLLFLFLSAPFLLWYFFKFHNKENKERESFSVFPTDLTGSVGKDIWAFRKIVNTILINLDYEKVAEKVVNLIINELNYMKLGYKVCVLTLVDKQEQIVRRVSFSETPEAFGVLAGGNVKFHEVKIPLSSEENVLVRAIKDKKAYVTHDLSDVFYPEKSREVWRNVQKQVGIKTSLVFPLIVRGESIGAMIFSLSKSEKDISDNEKAVLFGFTDAVAVALENASLYKQLKQANEELKELDKRKDEFISIAAHELRAPMTAIKGYMSMIMDGDAGKIPPKASEFLAGALEGSERLIRLVNNMLNVSRIEAGRMVYNMSQVALEKLVEKVIETYKLEAEKKGLQLIYNKPDKVFPSVYADPDRLEEVISNLVINAIKYTNKGSITVSLIQKDNRVQFSVKDTGIGIQPEDKKKLFCKFVRGSTGDSISFGSGLGLYISKLLIEKFGGTIGFESMPDKGSNFWFELPIKTS